VSQGSVEKHQVEGKETFNVGLFRASRCRSFGAGPGGDMSRFGNHGDNQLRGRSLRIEAPPAGPCARRSHSRVPWQFWSSTRSRWSVIGSCFSSNLSCHRSELRGGRCPRNSCSQNSTSPARSSIINGCINCVHAGTVPTVLPVLCSAYSVQSIVAIPTPY
jgi:hypothetical protein